MVSKIILRGHVPGIAVVILMLGLLAAGSAGAENLRLTGTDSHLYGSELGSEIRYPEEGATRPYKRPFASQAISGVMPAHVQNAANEIDITQVGHFGGVTYAAEPAGNHVYMGQGSAFVVLDISNKAAPVEVGRVETSGIIIDIALAGNYAYVWI